MDASNLVQKLIDNRCSESDIGLYIKYCYAFLTGTTCFFFFLSYLWTPTSPVVGIYDGEDKQASPALGLASADNESNG